MSEKSKASGIVWLASYPKSGNTWTRTFLHNLLKTMRGEGGDGQDINAMNEFTAWEIALSRFHEVLGRDPREVDRAEIAKARPEVQRRIADEAEGVAFIKTHHALVLDRGVPVINFAVTSGAVYIVRNPLDVAISYAHHMGADIDTAIAAMAETDMETRVTDKSVYEVFGSWSQHVMSWAGKPHRAIYVMRYENMLAEPEKSFGGLARHLLLDASRDQLAQAIDLSRFDRLKEQEEKEGFRERPEKAERFFREGRAGQWRERLTGRQIDRIVADHKPVMEKFGYWPLR
ncbi:MAG: sulfotransferase domain-containing protein [Roseiarcus sp.]|jgi:hypothetical protein